MTQAEHKIGATILAVASASASSLFACHLCVPRERASLWSERALLWGHRYRAFVAGLLLATSLFEVLPFLVDAFTHLYATAGVEVNYPLPQIALCFGFLLSWGLHVAARCRCRGSDSCCAPQRPAAETRARSADIELQQRRSAAPPRVADVSSSEEDIVYDSGEVWTPLMNGGVDVDDAGHRGVALKRTPAAQDEDEEDDEEEEDERDSAVVRLLSDPAIDASVAEKEAEEEAEAEQGAFYMSYVHIAFSFSLIAGLARPGSIWLLGLAISSYTTIATHQLCAFLIERFSLLFLFAFSFFAATITAASGLSLGFFLEAGTDSVPLHVIGCLVWSAAGGCQLFAACLHAAGVLNHRVQPLQVVAAMALATLVAACLKGADRWR